MQKRLFTRLKSLESSANQRSDLDQADRRLLISALGRRDALFWPHRFQPHRAAEWGEILQRQREYSSAEVGLAVKAQGRGDWKSASERRQKLIDGGYLSAIQTGRQVQSVFLTATGEAEARALVGWLAVFHESIDILQRLYELSGRRMNVPVRESALWDHPCTGAPHDWNHLTERVLPLLTSGTVRATSDSVGRIAYSLIAEAAIPESVATETQAEEWASNLYLATFNRERKSLESVDIRNGLEVAIPLPSTGW